MVVSLCKPFSLLLYCFSLIIQDNFTALMIAVYHGQSHIVEVLIRLKSDVNLQTKVSVVTDCVHMFAKIKLQLKLTFVLDENVHIQ